jgi:hypothetical protein
MSVGRLLTIVCLEPSFSDRALCKIAEFWGLEAELVSANDYSEPMPEGCGRVVALAYPVLQYLRRQGRLEGLIKGSVAVLVYSFQAERDSPELKEMTKGAFTSAQRLEAGRKEFIVHAGVRYGEWPVSGRSYSAEAECCIVFRAEDRSPGIVERYISVDGHPYFACTTHGQTPVFLLAEEKLVDVDTALPPETSLRPWYAQLIATSVFLRAAFGAACWTAPVIGATFIVDDPYLRERYGFIRYHNLLNELRRCGCALSIAFIPYNYRRTEPQFASVLCGWPDQFSIAVHGCDHTGGEFASVNEQWLTGISSRALERMERHTAGTRMPFDKVMVFPQGRFSRAAINALQAHDFAAAVNSTPWSEDIGEDSLTIRELLEVAVTHYRSLPIYVRRYPHEIFDCAFDAFFQKPVLAVEHHEFFRHGYSSLTAFVQDLGKLNTNLSWMPLGKTLTSSCVMRLTGNSQYTVRHFTPTLRLRNPASGEISLRLEKPEDSGRVEAVLVGGNPVPFEVDSGWLRYPANLQAGEELDVSVCYQKTPYVALATSWKYELGASMRRLLSDFRDNHLAKHERVLNLANKLKRMLY